MSHNGNRISGHIAVLGGTGKEGSGLAYRWAYAGYQVIIGSRTQDKARRVAAELNDMLGKDSVRGLLNEDAAREAEVVVLTVPYSAHRATLESVYDQAQGKILVDVTVPIKPPDFTVVHLPEGRTAAEEAQAILGSEVRVVSAFQNVSAVHLRDITHEVECDIFVCGDDEDAKQMVVELVEAAGMQGFDAGPLANAIVAESLTPVLLGINKRYGVKGAGIRITRLKAD